MHDFKVGDRVIYKAASVTRTPDHEGHEGVVTEIKSDDTVRVDWDDKNLVNRVGYLMANLLHVTPEVITINRADLPEVTDVGGSLHSGTSDYFTDPEFGAAKHRRLALQQLAVAEFLEAREKAAEEVAAATLLSKRRNDLAKEVAKKAGWNDWEHASYYSHQSEAQAAIDMMIAAEDDRG